MKLNAGILVFAAMLPFGIPSAVIAQTTAPIAFEVVEQVDPQPSPEEASRPPNTRMPTNARSPQEVPSSFDEIEPNNVSAQATPLSGNQARVRGNIFANGDVDFWSFTGQAGDRVYAATMTSRSSNASVDSTLDVIASDGTTIVETDLDDGSFGATSSSIAGTVLPSTGTFYLRVRHNSATAQLRPYDLYFQLRSGAPTAETEANDTLPGQALPAGGWVSGSTSSTTDADLYSLNLSAGDTVFISVDLDPERDTTEWNAQVGLGAFGTPPLILVVDDAGSATPDSEAFFTTVEAAGTYSVLVGLPTGGTTFGTYHASVSVFPRVNQGVNCTTYTSTNVPVAIPTGPGIVTSTLTIPGNPRIADVDVSVNLTHNFMADLDVQLTAPGGNTVGLFSDIGSTTVGAQTTMSTTFDDEAAVPSLFTVINGNRVAPELNYRLSWFDGQPAGGTWTMTIRDDASGDGGTLNSWSMTVCEAPPAPACAVGFVPQTVYSTDFESGAAGFTHSGTLDEWELGNPSAAPVSGCNSGTNCWKTDLDNTYENNSNQTLLSPNINLAGLSAPVVVRWAQKYQVERPDFDNFSVDLQVVGTPASAVRLYQHLGADMVDNVGNPTVTVQEAAGWAEHSVRADVLAGQNVEFLANLNTDTTVQRGGVAIDDVSVTACRALSANLSITKTDFVTSATPGGSVTYTITASNAGPDAVTGATVADTFPATLTCSTTCAGALGGVCGAAGPFGGNINDAGVNLPAGGSVTYTSSCTIAASATGTLSNTATVASSTTDPDPANNSATDNDTVLVPSANLAITKTDGVTSATPGGSVTYAITASNAGPSNAPAAIIADTFPATLTCSTTCVGAGGGTCTAGPFVGNINDTASLPAGGSVTYTSTCAINPSAGGTLSNTATVSGAATDPDPANNSATDSNTVLAPSADLSITKTDGVTSATPGGSVTYAITASNAGPSNAPAAIIADTFPATLTCSTTCVGAGGGTCTAGPFVGNINDTASLPAGGSVTYTSTCAISGAATGSLTNTATVTSTCVTRTPEGGCVPVNDPTPGNNSATDVDALGASADLSITKTDGVATATAGGSVTYTIVASNAGPSNAPGATVADTFPASLTCSTTCVGASGGTCTAGPFAGNINDTVNLPSGGSVTYSSVCTISGSASGNLSNTATVTAPGGVTDPTPANNSATDTDTLFTPADVSGTKTVSGSFLASTPLTYSIVLTNAGPSTQLDNPGDEFIDVLPAGLTLVSASASSGTATASVGINTVTWNGSIPAGGSVTITINATINAGAVGVISNQGTINYDSTGDGSNDASRPTDDPAAGGGADPTTFAVLSPATAIPALQWFGLIFMALLIAGVGLRQQRGA